VSDSSVVSRFATAPLNTQVSSPTVEEHKQFAEKEQLRRIHERAMGKKCNQRMMLGTYQTHWPDLNPSK